METTVKSVLQKALRLIQKSKETLTTQEMIEVVGRFKTDIWVALTEAPNGTEAKNNKKLYYHNMPYSLI